MEQTLSELVTKLKEVSYEKAKALLHMRDLEFQEHDLEQAILNFHNIPPQNNTTLIPVGYSASWKPYIKAARVLELSDKCMTNADMVAMIMQIENRNEKDYRSKLISQIAASVGEKAKKSQTFKRFEQYGDWYYGLAEWFNEDGSLKPAYTDM